MTYHVSLPFVHFLLIRRSETNYFIKLKKQDRGLKNTHQVLARLIRLSIETGCVTGQWYYFSSLFYFLSI